MENVIDIRAWKAKKIYRAQTVLVLRKSSLDQAEFCKRHSLDPQEVAEWVAEIEKDLAELWRKHCSSGGERIKQIREVFQVSIEELSDMTGLTESYLEDLESGKVPIDRLSGVKIAVALTVEPLPILYHQTTPSLDERHKVELLYYRIMDPSAYRKRLIIKFTGGLLIAFTLLAVAALLFSGS